MGWKIIIEVVVAVCWVFEKKKLKFFDYFYFLADKNSAMTKKQWALKKYLIKQFANLHNLQLHKIRASQNL